MHSFHCSLWKSLKGFWSSKLKQSSYIQYVLEIFFSEIHLNKLLNNFASVISANNIRVRGRRRPSASRMYPWAPWELSGVSEVWAGNIRTRFPIKQGNSDQHAGCANRNQVGCPCSKLSNEHQATVPSFFLSLCHTKRHRSDGLH